MRSSKPIRILFTALGLCLLAGCGDDEQVERFTATLSGQNEVPAVTTSANGEAAFTKHADHDHVEFELRVRNIADVTAAHLHAAAAGQNGPIVVTLFSGNAAAPNGTLASGEFEAEDIDGGMSLEQIVAAMRSGALYVNVHTAANPAGEIRGQVQVVD